MNQYSNARDLTGAQRAIGTGLAGTWICGRCCHSARDDHRSQAAPRRHNEDMDLCRMRREDCRPGRCEGCSMTAERAKRGERMAVIVAALRSAGAAGLSLDEAQAETQIERGGLISLLNHYCTKGIAWNAGVHGERRFYDLATVPVGSNANAPRPPRPPAPKRQRRAKPFRHVSVQQRVEVVGTSDGVKITRIPAVHHDIRFQIDPASSFYGAGFSAVGVGRDVDTGKPWGSTP